MKKNMSNIFRLFYNDYKSINYMPSLANVNFGLKEVPFLGHVISVEGIAVDVVKSKKYSNGWKYLRSVMQICCFLKLAGYYR
jgi:hypothetical protein